MHLNITPRVHQQLHPTEGSWLNPFERPFVVDSNSMCAPEFGHPICPSAVELESHRSEGSDVSSSAGSESEQLGATECIISHDGVSEITGKTEATTVDDDVDVDVDEAHFRDPVLICDKQDQHMHHLHPRISPYQGLAKIAPVIHFSGPPFGDGEVVDSPPGFIRVGIDKDQLPNELEQRVGPARHYHQLGICDATPERVALQSNGIHPSLGQVNASWRRPEERTSEIREIIQQVEKSGLLQHATAASHHQEFNASLHCTKSSPASAPPMAAVGKLKAVIGRFLAAMDEDELAAIGMLLAAIVAAHFGATEDNTPPREAYWKASPSSSSTTRQTRMNEYPKGVIQRLMPRGGKIYFGMDMDSFALAKIDPGFTNYIRDAAIKAAEEFREQNLGIAFAYDPSRKVFSIRYDPGLDRGTLANAFFPSDSPERWHVRVSSLADNMWVFADNRDSMPKIFGHEFAHILGLRHHDAGSNPKELEDPSALWLGTRDGNCDTIMRTGVHSSELRLFEEDFRVIREFYSKTNGALVGGVRIVDVDPDEKDISRFEARRLISLIRSRKIHAQD